MESLSEVYEALHQKFPDTTDLDPYGREVVINGSYPLLLYEDTDCIYVRTSLDDQTFTQQMPDYDAVYRFAYGVLSKRVSIKRASEKSIKVTGYDRSPKNITAIKNKRSVQRAIICTLLSLILLGFTVMMTITMFMVINWHSKTLLFDLCPMGLALMALTAAISLLFQGYTRNPLNIARCIGYAAGIIMAGFGVIMLLCTWGGSIDDMSTGDYVGMTILFLFALASGIFIMVIAVKPNFGLQSAPPYIVMRDVPLPPFEDVCRLVAEIRSRTKKKSLRLIERKGFTPTLTCSKLGGVPYWEKDRPYPESDGTKLVMAAQINLSEAPPVPELPDHGLLQFFLPADDEDISGFPATVIYHETIDPTVTAEDVMALGISTAAEDFEYCEIFARDNIPLLLVGEDMMMTADSAECNSIMHSIAEELGITLDPTLEYYELTVHLPEGFSIPSGGSQILGYPEFAYDDPRSDSEMKYDTLLLQLSFDSPAMYASGKAHFFISGEALAQLDFSDVIFYIDYYT